MGNWRKAWEAARTAAGLPNLRLYDLRHHAITRMLEREDVPERAVIDLAGHVSPAMLKRYSHIRMSVKKRAVDALVTPKSKLLEEPSPVVKQKKPPERLERVHEAMPDALDVLWERAETEQSKGS
jgi:hypothetical protein